MKKKMNNKGFTLVELLAVVVVLAIVAAIAMRSITGIIKNNRIDSFSASINSAIEGAQLSCVQEGTLAEIKSTVEGNSVDVDPVTDADGNITNQFTVKAKSSGEFKGLDAGDAKTNARIIKGVKGLKDGDSITCSGKPVTCTVTYNTCTSSY